MRSHPGTFISFKRKSLRRSKLPLKRSKLAKRSKSPSSKAKERIQALLRLRAIERDGGCVLRNYPEAGKCGGYTKNGDLILQAEHLNGRANSVSYADMDNIVCLCLNHHFFFKKRESALYWSLIEKIIGQTRWQKVQKWIRDKTPHYMNTKDWLDAEERLCVDLK